MLNPCLCFQMPDWWIDEQKKLEIPQAASDWEDTPRVHHVVLPSTDGIGEVRSGGVHYNDLITAVHNYFVAH